MTFKSLSKKDTELLVEFNKQYFKDGWTESMIISAFSTQGFCVLGAFNENGLIGYVAFTLGLDSADIESVVICPSERNKGIAVALLESAESKIKEAGIDKILLEVRESNIPAISLYKKRNFGVISKRNKYYHDGENALVMIKELV